MKKALVILAAAAFVFALPACKKCSTCKYSVPGLLEYNTEFCGNKADVDTFESSCKTAATAVGVTCSCSKS